LYTASTVQDILVTVPFNVSKAQLARYLVNGTTASLVTNSFLSQPTDVPTPKILELPCQNVILVSGNRTIHRYSSSGVFLDSFGQFVGAPESMSLHQGLLYVADFIGSMIVVLNYSTLTEVSNWTATSPVGLGFPPIDDGFLYVTQYGSGNDAVFRYNITTGIGTIFTPFQGCNSPFSIAWLLDGSVFLVTCAGVNQLKAFNATTGSPVPFQSNVGELELLVLPNGEILVGMFSNKVTLLNSTGGNPTDILFNVTATGLSYRLLNRTAGGFCGPCTTDYVYECPALYQVATYSCLANTSCGIGSCQPGYLNCDGIVSNGCEVNGTCPTPSSVTKTPSSTSATSSQSSVTVVSTVVSISSVSPTSTSQISTRTPLTASRPKSLVCLYALAAMELWTNVII